MIGVAGYRSRDAALLLLLGAAAWALVIVQARSAMGGITAAFVPFAVAWTVMMAAMMLPSAAPVAALYAHSASGDRAPLALFTAGYLLTWAATSVPAFVLAELGASAGTRLNAGRWLAAAAFLLTALYQVTPLKAFCLEQCRSPISGLLRYAGYGGYLRGFRAGAHHGLYCLGCCWPLMLLLPVLGMLNLVAVALLAAFVVAEKNLSRGRLITRAAALAAAALAAAALALPALSAGLSA